MNKFCITVEKDYSIKVERITGGSISGGESSIRKYLFLCGGDDEELIDISSAPVKSEESSSRGSSTEEAAAIVEPAKPVEPFDASVYRCSNKIRQTLMILSVIWQKKDEIINPRANIAEAIKIVSDKLGINHSTVYDKITRQNGITIDEFGEMVSEWLEENSFEKLRVFLRNEIEKSRTPRTERACNADVQALYEFVKTIS